MSFRIKPHETIKQGLRRVARSQIDKMIAQIDAEDRDEVVVHDVRKRCKKLRGLARLVRPALKGSSTYAQENQWYRDAAQSLSFVRDSQSMVEAFDEWMERFDEHVDSRSFASIRQWLVERREAIAHENGDLEEKLQHFRELCIAGRLRVDDWQLSPQGFAAVSDGLEKTYQRGRAAMKQAKQDPTTENLHEWRKRVKYHWFHSKLLRQIWPQELSARAAMAKRISDLLGDDHDLAVLTQTLTAEGPALAEPATMEALFGLIHTRRKQLQWKAFAQGKRLYAEKPSALVGRLGAYWKAWKMESEAPALKAISQG